MTKSPFELRDWINAQVENHTGELWDERGYKGALVGLLNKTLDGDDNRKILLAWLFGSDEEQLSTKDLTDPQWIALRDWAALTEVAGDWTPAPGFEEEAVLALLNAINETPGDAIVNEAMKLGATVTKTSTEQMIQEVATEIADNPELKEQVDRAMVDASLLEKTEELVASEIADDPKLKAQFDTMVSDLKGENVDLSSRYPEKEVTENNNPLSFD